MSKIIKYLTLGLTVVSLSFGNNLALAKEHGGHAKEHGGKEHGGNVPPGWTEGRKEGWEGASKPQGLVKKEVVQVEKKVKPKPKPKKLSK